MKRQKYNKANKVVPFIAKLYDMIDKRENHHLIRWTFELTSFVIVDPIAFREQILPQYFKHSNNASFIRQLNLYSFTKVRIDLEGENVYHHPLFAKGCHEQLKSIKRKQIPASVQTEEQNEMLNQNSSAEFMNCIDFDSQEIQVCAKNFPEFQSPEISNAHNLLLMKDEKDQPASKMIMLKEKIDYLRESQKQMQDFCMNLLHQNKRLQLQSYELQQQITDEAHNKDIILKRISNFVLNYLQENPQLIDGSLKISSLIDAKTILGLLEYLDENKEEEIFFSEDETKIKKLFYEFSKFVENNEISFVLKCLSNFLNGELKKKRKSYTIMHPKQELKEKPNENSLTELENTKWEYNIHSLLSIINPIVPPKKLELDLVFRRC